MPPPVKSSTVRRAVVSAIPLALAALLCTCQLDELVSPSPPPQLLISPPEINDSAALGTTGSRVRSLAVKSEDPGGSWRASVSGGSQWLELDRTQDTVPSTLGVSLKPAGLQAGTYRDTVLVTPDGADQPVKVPVSFAIAPLAGHAPGLPTALGQLKIDGTTAIPVGGQADPRTA